jgi:NDP-sugar pyrophosphorylase family protein
MRNSNYKVLITTSGIGSRLGEITDFTNKSLVVVGDKPAISYIIEKYPSTVPIVITLGHFGDHVRQFLNLAYPDRIFEFVEVKPYRGPGSSLAYSILQARHLLQQPLMCWVTMSQDFMTKEWLILIICILELLVYILTKYSGRV